jgi:catechol 2,3-dioxygenase-like lactoylglutathione lyase family enzyme
MIDHIVIPVSDLAQARAFYTPALAAIGSELVLEFPGTVGYGEDRKPSFCLREGGLVAPAHVAFACPDRETVEAFHTAALAAGGVDNGGPGLREIYHPHYYGAFVLDPDGHNIEAVCHSPQG